MMRTVAPKDLGGRLLRNLARTTPELPEQNKILVAEFAKASYSIEAMLPETGFRRRETVAAAALIRVDAYRGDG
jgi:hypothetical protein